MSNKFEITFDVNQKSYKYTPNENITSIQVAKIYQLLYVASNSFVTDDEIENFILSNDILNQFIVE